MTSNGQADGQQLPLTVNDRDAAALVGVSERHWRNLWKSGKAPPPTGLGGRHVNSVDELTAWAAAGCPPLRRWRAMQRKK